MSDHARPHGTSLSLSRAEALFHEAAALPVAERAVLLEARCGSDAELRAFVTRLLDHHDRRLGGFLDPPFAASQADTRTSEMPAATLRIGPYTVVDRIGEGGMGTVFRAVQNVPVRREVALKVIKPGMDSRQVVARFEAERQALALMDHPNIAKVLDAGETESGRPYFVMELVRGEPITDYCDRMSLSIEARLELFLDVCRAVQHAHQKGVIHRDLKPSNVLVTEIDGRPRARVIDFGLAKALGGALTEKSLMTQAGMLLGTPEYMSPEQAASGGADVDTRTDVYSLGAILYELLVGTAPFDSSLLRDAGLEAMLRAMREKDPVRPSSRVSEGGQPDSEATARCRSTDVRRLARTIRGELDWIVLKALERHRARRYDSASSLAADISRYLADQPVLAGAPGVAYRFGKFVKRHGVVVAATAGIFLAVVAAWIQSDIQRRRVQVERDRAEATIGFLTDVLGTVSPDAHARGYTLEASIRDAEKSLATRFHDQPTVEARLRTTLGRSYRLLGDYPAAHANLARAIGLASGAGGANDPITLRAMFERAATYANEHKPDSAIALHEVVLARQRRILGEEHDETVQSMIYLGGAYFGKRRFPEAIAMVEKGLAILQRRYGEDDPRTLFAAFALGTTYRVSGDQTRALAILEPNEKRFRGHPEFGVTRWLEAATELGRTYGALHRYPEADSLLREAAAEGTRIRGGDHPRVAQTILYLGISRLEAGRFEAAAEAFRDCASRLERSTGPTSSVTLEARRYLAQALDSLAGRAGRARLPGERSDPPP